MKKKIVGLFLRFGLWSTFLNILSCVLEKNVYSAVVSNKAQYNAATPPQGYPPEHELQAFMFIASTEDYSQNPHTIQNSINRKKDK